MGQIKLKNGTIFQNSILAESPSDRSILLTIPEGDIVKYAVLFGTPANTEEITFTSGFFKTTYFGYTNIKSITDDPNTSHTLVRLGAGETTDKKVEYAVPEEYVPLDLRLPKDETT